MIPQTKAFLLNNSNLPSIRHSDRHRNPSILFCTSGHSSSFGSYHLLSHSNTLTPQLPYCGKNYTLCFDLILHRWDFVITQQKHIVLILNAVFNASAQVAYTLLLLLSRLFNQPMNVSTNLSWAFVDFMVGIIRKTQSTLYEIFYLNIVRMRIETLPKLNTHMHTYLDRTFCTISKTVHSLYGVSFI